MATAIRRIKKNKPKQTVHAPRYVTVTEYIRLRHTEDLKKDPLADPLWATTIKSAIDRGAIIVHEENGTKWIDWNKYGTLLFKRYRQMPQKRVIKRSKK